MHRAQFSVQFTICSVQCAVQGDIIFSWPQDIDFPKCQPSVPYFKIPWQTGFCRFLWTMGNVSTLVTASEANLDLWGRTLLHWPLMQLQFVQRKPIKSYILSILAYTQIYFGLRMLSVHPPTLCQPGAVSSAQWRVLHAVCSLQCAVCRRVSQQRPHFFYHPFSCAIFPKDFKM